jgi:RNA polymerase sigma factor (sigma-70 family)
MTEAEIRGSIAKESPDLDLVIKAFYDHTFDRLTAWLVYKGATLEDAKDVFQDAIVVLIQKAKENPEAMPKSLFPYFYQICKHIWFRRLRNERYKQSLVDIDDLLDEETAHAWMLLEQDEENEDDAASSILMQLIENALDGPCRLIFEAMMKKKHYDGAELAVKLGLPSANAVAQKAKRCKAKIIQTALSDPYYFAAAMQYLEGTTAYPQFRKYRAQVFSLMSLLKGTLRDETERLKIENRLKSDENFREFAAYLKRQTKLG